MNEMIERYIYDVTRRLPEKERSEVGHDLEATIADMLPDNPNEQDITDVLTKLGAPYILAEQYRQKPRYLISPAMFELYISVLKRVVGIVASVFACIGMLTATLSGTIGDIIEAGISSAFDGALQAAFWVTFGFVMADRYGEKQKLWEVSDLPQLPDRKGVKISRSSSIVEMLLSAFFTVILIRNSIVINPFSQTALDRSIPYILLLGGFGMIINGLKLYWARWNIPLCAANIIYNIVWVVVVSYITRWPDLLSDEFIKFTTDSGVLHYIWSGRIVVFIVFIIVVIDIVTSVWNTCKGTIKG